MFVKARKLPKQTPDLKADLEAFEAKLEADAAEAVEEEAAAAAAHAQAASSMQEECSRPMAAAGREGTSGATLDVHAVDSQESAATAADDLLGNLPEEAVPQTQLPNEGETPLSTPPHLVCQGCL
jgi:hypothetical protein